MAKKLGVGHVLSEKRAPDDEGKVQLVNVGQIVVGTNHRETNGDVGELARSIESVGLLQPIVVRDRGTKGFELVAGARRLAAVKELGWDAVRAIVREMTDEQAIQAQVIENLQRENVHPLEEAEGFRTLATVAKLTVSEVGDRIGRSPRYVYDRLRLLDLVAPAKKLFREGKITAAHAILIARLKTEHQKAVLDPESRALFEREDVSGLLAIDDVPARGLEDRMKVRSVDELRAWIAKHTKFSVARGTIDELFPETVKAVEAAKSEKRRIVQITYDAMTHPDARDDERVFGPRSWKRAKKPCPRVATGVVVVGPHQGEAFDVCTTKTCRVHWGAEIAAKKKEEKKRATGKGDATEREVVARAREEAARQKQEAARERWRKAIPAITAAIDDACHKSGIVPMTEVVIGDVMRGEKKMRGGGTAEGVIRDLAAYILIGEAANEWGAHETFPKRAKEVLGLDVSKIVAEAVPEAKAEAPAAGKAKRVRKAKG